MLTGAYRFPAMDSVVFGKPFVKAAAQEVDRVEARAVFILASGTLARETDTVERLSQMLGNRLAGIYAKIGAHTPRTDVVAAANAAREAGADLIVTLGGGSVTDAARWSASASATTSPTPHSSITTALRSLPTGLRGALRSTRQAFARSRSRRHCRPASTQR